MFPALLQCPCSHLGSILLQEVKLQSIWRSFSSVHCSVLLRMIFSKSFPMADVSVIPLQFEDPFCPCYFVCDEEWEIPFSMIQEQIIYFCSIFQMLGRIYICCVECTFVTPITCFLQHVAVNSSLISVFPTSPALDHFIFVFLSFIFGQFSLFGRM